MGDYSDARLGFYIVAILSCVGLGPGAGIILLPISLFIPGQIWIGAGMSFLLAITIVILAGRYASAWVDRVWRRQYEYMATFFRASDAATLLLQPERWERAQEILNEQRWLKPFASLRARTTEQLLEMAGDNWRAMIALTQNPGHLRRALSQDRQAQLANRLVATSQGGMFWLILMPVCFLIPLIGLLVIMLTMSHLENRATQVALIDFLLE